MPIFEFKCKSCGKISEFILGHNKDRNAMQCRFCGSNQLEKIFSVPSMVKAEGGSQDFPRESGECCGITNPCDDPKRCCTK